MEKYKFNERLLSALNRVLLLTHAEIAEMSHITLATYYNTIKAPETISVQRLLDIANGLHVPVRRFFYTGRVSVIGTRDDYIMPTEDYKRCWYDTDAVRKIVGYGKAFTWKEVARAVGLHPNRVPEAFLATRPLPVERLQTFCEAFNLDLFDFIIDPNPHLTRRRNADADTAALIAEMAKLQQQLTDTRRELSELKKEMDSLRKAHNILARRVNVNIEHINDSYLSIAADPQAGYGK